MAYRIYTCRMFFTDLTYFRPRILYTEYMYGILVIYDNTHTNKQTHTYIHTLCNVITNDFHFIIVFFFQEQLRNLYTSRSC